MLKYILPTLALVLATQPSLAEDCSTPSAVRHASPRDAEQPIHLPQIGKWMIDSNGHVAHWLGETFKGRILDEPINMIFEVHAANTQEAKEKFLTALRLSGYTPRTGHSSGYQAVLGSRIWSQLPAQEGFAFANGPAKTPTNHGRAFGPLSEGGSFFFIAAFSRENVDLLCRVFCPSYSWHKYDSFTYAREALTGALTASGNAVFRGYVELENEITCAVSETTGDHDGRAALLEI